MFGRTGLSLDNLLRKFGQNSLRQIKNVIDLAYAAFMKKKYSPIQFPFSLFLFSLS